MIRSQTATFVLALSLTGSVAGAQTYINQTSCVTGACIVGGALQTQTVDCNAGQKVGTALASIADRNGPNVINVSGTCNEGINIVGHNRLTIAGSATFTQPFNVNASRNISLTGITIQGFAGLFLADSQVTLTNTTVRNSTTHGIVVAGGSNLGLNGIAPGNAITNNAMDGINVGPAGSAGIGGFATISGNGRAGVRAHDGGQATMTSGNVNGTVDISNNGEAGVQAESQSSVYLTSLTGGMVHVHDNNDNGVNVLASTAVLEGNVVVENNAPAGSTPALFQGAVAVGAGTLVLNPGVQISGSGAGVVADVKSSVVLGDATMPGMSNISGGTSGVSLSNGSMALGLSASTISSLACDATSWTSGSLGTVVGDNSCGDGAPVGLVGEQGPQGEPGAQGPQGEPGPQGPEGPAAGAVSGSLLFLTEGSSPPIGYVRLGSYREERVDLDAPGGKKVKLMIVIWRKL